MAKSTLSKSLRIIAAAVDALDEQELEALAAGKGKLAFIASSPSEEQSENPVTDTGEIVRRLQACADRLEARRVLAQVQGRDALVSLAKSQKIHVAKNDRRDDLENKLVEFLVGSKLRTQAIQSLNLSGNSAPSCTPEPVQAIGRPS